MGLEAGQQKQGAGQEGQPDVVPAGNLDTAADLENTDLFITDLSVSAEKADELIRSHLEQTLPARFPDTFSSEVAVAVFEGSGLTARAFVADGTDGNKYFIKVRSMLPEEIEQRDEFANRSNFAKEAAVTQLLAEEVVPVARVLPPQVLDPHELPEGLRTVEMRFGAVRPVEGEAKPYVVMVQEFQQGTPAMASIHNHEVSLRANEALGRGLKEIHSVVVDGFGGDFNVETGKFALTYEEHIDSYNTDEQVADLVERGIVAAAQVEVITEMVQKLRDANLTATLSHSDLNTGNYLIDEQGNLEAIIDWETARGLPWQQDLAMAINKIEASTIYISPEEKSERIGALLRGYGRTGQELRENKELIDAFRTIDAVEFMHAFHVRFNNDGHLVHTPAEYRSVINDTYEIDREGTGQNFIYCLLAFEGIMTRAVEESAARRSTDS